MTTPDEEITGYGGMGKASPDFTSQPDNTTASDSVAHPTAEDVRATARQATEEIKAKGKSQLDGYRETAADELEKVAHSAEAAARELEGQDTLGLSGYVSDMAQSMVRLSDNLRGKSVDELIHDVNRLARDNPALFIAGSIALGFGLTRFAKASARHTEDDYRHRQASSSAASPDASSSSRHISDQQELNRRLDTGEPGTVGSISNAGVSSTTQTAGIGATGSATSQVGHNGRGTDGGLHP